MALEGEKGERERGREGDKENDRAVSSKTSRIPPLYWYSD
jgi:hypothetical protein